MDTTTIIVAIITAIVLFVIGGILGVWFSRRQRTKRLQEKFGPEYDRTLNEIEDQSKAEDELEARLDHVDSLEIHSLSEKQKERFADKWNTAQAKFVDQPLVALQEADQLIKEIMLEKGYPVEDFEQRAADISVDYPELVVDYRSMREIVSKGDREETSTEDARQAMIHARSLFEELLGKDMSVYKNQKEKV